MHLTPALLRTRARRARRPCHLFFSARARRFDLPVIYVNDNFGHWRSDFAEVFTHCTRRKARGRQVSRRLKPGRNDYFILKPRHSGFFATSLAPLLEHLKIDRLILAGIAANLCVLFTAHDAHMHRYPIIVLSDCQFGLTTIQFLGGITSGRVIFADDDAEPLLGVTALESVGILVDTANKTLKRLPAIPLK